MLRRGFARVAPAPLVCAFAVTLAGFAVAQPAPAPPTPQPLPTDRPVEPTAAPPVEPPPPIAELPIEPPQPAPPPVAYPPQTATPPPSWDWQTPASDRAVSDDKSPAIAGLLSGLSTGVPLALGFALVASVESNRDVSSQLPAGLATVALGASLGPSAGIWYAGETGRGLATAGGRFFAFASSVGLGFGGVASLSTSDSAGAGVFMIVMSAVTGCVGLGLMVWDLVDAPSAASRANRDSVSARELVPTLMFGPTGGAAAWQF